MSTTGKKKKTIKNTDMWRLKNTLLDNQQITEEIKKQIKICIGTNENENTTIQNLWYSVKAVLRGSFHSNSKERKCQRMLKLPHNCTHLTC